MTNPRSAVPSRRMWQPRRGIIARPHSPLCYYSPRTLPHGAR